MPPLFLFIFAWLCYCLTLGTSVGSIQNVGSNVFDSLTNSSVYNKWSMPMPKDDTPLEVKVRAYVYHFTSKETTKLDIKMQMLIEISWIDDRLKYEENTTGLNIIIGEKKYVNSIWTPHIFFTNEKQTHKIGRISKNDYVSILPSGLVVLTARLKTAMFCLLHFEDFPFDRQKCHISISSWRYSSHLLNLVWDQSMPLQLEKMRHDLVEFEVLSIKNKTSLNKLSPQKSDEALEFTSLTIWLELRRHYEYYFINYYLPSILLVIISWVAFWLEPAAISTGRVTIGISTMLTFINLCWSTSVQTASQNITTDVWAVTCTTFIILSLVESAFVNTIDRKGGREKVQIKKPSSKHIFRGGIEYAAGRAKLRRPSSCPSSPEIKRHFAKEKKNISKTMEELRAASLALGNLASTAGIQQTKVSHNVFALSPQEIAIWIDEKSRIVFPVAFFIFNMAYWLPLFIVKG